MGIITETMPLVGALAGVWEEEYVHLDGDHEIIDHHHSRLVSRLFDGDDRAARFAQTNIYDWPDGSREILTAADDPLRKGSEAAQRPLSLAAGFQRLLVQSRGCCRRILRLIISHWDTAI